MKLLEALSVDISTERVEALLDSTCLSMVGWGRQEREGGDQEVEFFNVLSWQRGGPETRGSWSVRVCLWVSVWVCVCVLLLYDKQEHMCLQCKVLLCT